MPITITQMNVPCDVEAVLDVSKDNSPTHYHDYFQKELEYDETTAYIYIYMNVCSI